MIAMQIRLAVGAALVAVTGAAVAQTVHFPAGKNVFDARCTVCHQAGGKGQDGLAPPLTEYPGKYAGTPDGRRQLSATVLNGMFGEISVNAKTYNFKMPSFATSSDEDLAKVLNYIVFDLNHPHGAAKPFTASEIKAARAQSIDSSTVHAQRATLIKALGLP